MIANVSSVQDLINALLGMQKAGRAVHFVHFGREWDRPEMVDADIMLELVYVNQDGLIVGDQADDYKPKEGEVAVIAIS